MGWEWWNNVVCRRRQRAHKKLHGRMADVTHIRIWPWRVMRDAAEGILSQCGA